MLVEVRVEVKAIGNKSIKEKLWGNALWIFNVTINSLIWGMFYIGLRSVNTLDYVTKLFNSVS